MRSKKTELGCEILEKLHNLTRDEDFVDVHKLEICFREKNVHLLMNIEYEKCNCSDCSVGLKYCEINGLVEISGGVLRLTSDGLRRTEHRNDQASSRIVTIPIFSVSKKQISREDQDKFRRDLFKAYGVNCFISGDPNPDILEAAHIKPYADGGPSDITNGIILTKNLHGLFDKHLLTISINDDGSLAFDFHSSIQKIEHYKSLVDRKKKYYLAHVNKEFLIARLNFANSRQINLLEVE